MNHRNLKAYPNIAQSIGIVGIMILAQIILAPIMLFFPKLIGQDLSMLIYYILSVGGAFQIVLLIRKSKGQDSDFAFQLRNGKLLIFSILGSLALLVGVISPINSLMPMPESFRKILMDMAGQNGGASFILLVVAAPVFEELIFRGIMLDGLLKKYSPVKAILFSSFLFGFVHLNPWQFVTGMVVGIFSGWAYYRSRSLTLSMVIHATLNLTGFITRLFIDKDKMSENITWSEILGGFGYALLIAAAGILITVFCIYKMNKGFEPAELLIVGDKVQTEEEPNSDGIIDL